MTKPKIAARKPMRVDLEPGEHHWCACGESNAQPFCDGSHRGTSFTPLAFQVGQAEEAHLCLCKRTQNPPYCDGTHAKLGEEVAAAVVLKEGQEATDRDIRDFASERLAAFKVPRKILILDEIPKGATGKLQRIGLAEKLGLG